MRRGPGGVGAINRQRLARVNNTLNNIFNFLAEFKMVEVFSTFFSSFEF